MGFLLTLAERFSAHFRGLRRLAERSRSALMNLTPGVKRDLAGARTRAVSIAARARAAVAGDGTPNIGNDAFETAVSVADAAKRLMLEHLERDGIDLVVIHEVAFRSVLEASEAGADVTAAAVGATLGAIQTARAEGVDVEGPGRAAAAGALAAAEELGDVATERIRSAIQRRERGLTLVD